MARVGYFHHIVLEVSDIERSKEFYENALQLEPMGSDLWIEPGPNAFFRTADGQYVVLLEVTEVKPEGPGVHTNFALSPVDYDFIHEQLQERGSLIRDHREDERSVGEVSQYFDDPDGHRLQITAYSPEAFIVPAARRGKIVAGRIQDFPPGSVTYIKEGKFFIVRVGDSIVALNEVCTHRQCNVTYQQEHYRFWCACHNRRFTRVGVQIPRPKTDVAPLHMYRIEFRGDEIIVDTDVTVPRTEEQAAQLVPLPVGVA